MIRATLVAALVGVSFLFGGTGQAAERTDPSFFGMHDASIAGEPASDSGAGSYRVWDTSTSWRDVEVSKGVYDWTRLDHVVGTVRARHASVLMVLSGTPIWYAKDPTAPSAYGTGFCSPTNDLGAWRNYVTAVATRYKGIITSYEPVNEADILAFWCGDNVSLTSMARVAYKAIKAVDPHATVTSPSFADRQTENQSVIVQYMKDGGYRWCDVVSYHPYGMPQYGPEVDASLVKTLGDKLRALGIPKTIWSTEINYGLPMGNAIPQVAIPLTPAMQSAFVIRTYLMQRSIGVGRVYWYDWSSAKFLGVKMADTSGGALAPAAAFRTVRAWMNGRWLGCKVGRLGWYTCRVRTPAYDRVISWHRNKAPMPVMRKVTR